MKAKLDDNAVREIVRERYSMVATSGDSCCASGGDEQSCCGSDATSTRFGYSIDELRTLPDGADLALGCGNPTAIASIQAGETVVDLGSGGGIDCFLAARRVGENGRVIGVDMTAEMLARARSAAASGGYTNVEFRLGEIENLPIADATADLVISNCVINLSPDKARVFTEAARVLRPGGRLSVSDIVLSRPLRPGLTENANLLSGCISGASLQDTYLAAIQKAGFVDVVIESSQQYAKMEHLEALATAAGVTPADLEEIAAITRSISVSARKP